MTMKPKEERREIRNVSMYPRQWAIVELHALNFNGNASMALRRIIDEWAIARAAQNQPQEETR